MGNSISHEDRARELEKKLLSLSGLELDTELSILEIKINYQGENYIHTIKCGINNKEIMVLLHGYGGASVLYYPILKDLGKEYQVYAIDHLGMGLSSRPEFKCETTEETINFFIESMEEWRKVLGIDKFTLLGHSLGGYIAVQYAAKYTNNVTRLILLSPLGFSKRDLELEEMNEARINQHRTFTQRQLHGIRKKIWREKLVPSTIHRKYTWMFGFIIRRLCTKRLKVTSEVGKLIYEFFTTILNLPISSDKAIHLIMNSNFSAYIPFEEFIAATDIPTLVLYGDKDWMDTTGAKRVLKMFKNNYEVKYVPESGHQLIIENPKDLTKLIFSSILYNKIENNLDYN